MKYLQFLAQMAPEISFTSLNFDTYLTLLSENFVFAILFFFGIVAFAFLCYYSLCILTVFVSRNIGFSDKLEQGNSATEELVNI